MNRENISAHRRTDGRTPPSGRIGVTYQPKELCVIWLPERNKYLQGVTRHGLYTVADSSHALVADGDRATNLAELVMIWHSTRAVLRTHYGRTQ